jgi:Kdo2-lipid IVA lauroyltransferase/acyltransferase
LLRDLRHRLEYGIFLAAVFVLRAMPLDTAAGFSASIWRFVAPKTRRHRRALKNLEKAMPETTQAERETIALGMWDNLGRVMAETILMGRLLKDPSRLEQENPVLSERYRNKLAGAVFVSLHMGNWEVCIEPLTEIDARPAGVYRIVENPYVDRYVRSQRSLLFPGGLFATKSSDGFNTVMRIAGFVRSGGVLGVLADLVDWKGIPVPFFGHNVYATTAPAWLARHGGATLWVGRAVRIGKQSRFRFTVKELKVPRTGKPEEDVRALTANIQRQFEEWIREYPSQWMWSNKRWRDHELPGGTQD